MSAHLSQSIGHERSHLPRDRTLQRSALTREDRAHPREHVVAVDSLGVEVGCTREDVTVPEVHEPHRHCGGADIHRGPKDGAFAIEAPRDRRLNVGFVHVCTRDDACRRFAFVGARDDDVADGTSAARQTLARRHPGATQDVHFVGSEGREVAADGHPTRAALTHATARRVDRHPGGVRGVQ